MKRKYLTVIFLIAAFAIAHATAPIHESKAETINNKIVSLLKKEVGVDCSKIFLELHPRNVVDQLSHISNQIKTVYFQNVDTENCTFSASIQTVDNHKISIFGTYKCLKSIPVLKNNVVAGQIICEKDVKIKDFDLRFLSSLPDNFIQNSEQIVGMQAKTNIKSSSFVYPQDLKNPIILKANEIVDLVLNGDGFKITAKGKAIQSGGVGNLIRVQNIKSKKILFGTIIDNKTVEIRLQ